MKYALVLMADWANGLFAVLLASWVTGTEVLWWHFLVGIVLSHLPDIDAVPELLSRGKVAASNEHARDHRTFIHYPLLSLPLIWFGAWLFGYWGLVAAIATTLHLLNDFYGTGWGIQWGWPFSTRHYKLLGRRANRLRTILEREGDWEQLPHDERSLKLIVSWTEEEFSSYVHHWGVDDWIDDWYCRINWVSGVEYVLFVLALLLTVLTLL